jgi:hypothetical protein
VRTSTPLLLLDPASAAPAAAGGTGPAPTYVPGACNIGPEEIARRRAAAVTGLLATAGFAAALLVTGAPDPLRLLVAVPAAATTIAALQVRDRFCVAYAAQGVYNVDGPAGQATPVLDAYSRSRDRQRAVRMILAGAAIGLAAALALVLLP